MLNDAGRNQMNICWLQSSPQEGIKALNFKDAECDCAPCWNAGMGSSIEQEFQHELDAEIGRN